MTAQTNTPVVNTDLPEPKQTAEGGLYSLPGIAIATALGSPIAGGFLMGKNFKTIGKAQQAKQTYLYFVLGTFGLLFLSKLIPEESGLSNYSFTVFSTLITLFIAKHHQEQMIKQHISAQGKMFSNWRAAGIGLAFGFVFISAFLAIVYATMG